MKRYLELAPLPLALERTWECNILYKLDMTLPLLDLGCGEGIFAEVLFKDKLSTGIDPQAGELVRAGHFRKHEELIECFGNKIPKEAGSYKTILSNSVLEHIPDLKPVLIEAHRLLANDGNFYITVPTNYFDQYSVVCQLLMLLGLSDLAAKYRKFFNSFWAHFHYYDIDGWKAYLGECGFEVLKSKQYCSKFQGTFNDLMAPFSLLSFLQKKFFNTWFKFPALRKPFAILLSAIFERCSQVPENLDNGGIVFFHLRKKYHP